MKVELYKSKSKFLHPYEDSDYEVRILRMEGNTVYDIERYTDNSGTDRGCRIHYHQPICSSDIVSADYAITDSKRTAENWKEKLEAAGYLFLGGKDNVGTWYLHISHAPMNTFSFGWK